ncbi:MAG: SpoIIE family protein phosphatase [Acutalibacteraceae bacterium]
MKEVYSAKGQAVERSREDKAALSRQLAVAAVWAGVGFILPGAVIYGGMAPFGVSLAAAVEGPYGLLVYLLTLVGYLAARGGAFPLRYMAAVMAVAGIKWVLAGLRRVSEAPLFAPAIAFLATGSTGLALAVGSGLTLYNGMIVLTESLAAGGFAYFAAIVARLSAKGRGDRALTTQEQTGVVLVGSLVLMALSSYTVAGISPGRIVAITAILLMARSGREQGGSIAGVVLGIVMLLGAPTHTYLAGAYAFGGLLAGAFARFGRLASAGAFLASGIIVALGMGSELPALVGLYEVAAGCLLFIATPPAVDRRINAFFARARTVPAVEGLRRSVVARLGFTSRAMREVSTTVSAVSQKLAGLSEPDLGSVYRRASNEVCRGCGLCGFCWDTHFSDVMASFNDMTPVLRERGRVERSEIAGHLARHCGRADQIVRQVNRDYVDYLARESAWRRLTEIRGVVEDQFTGTAALLDELAGDFGAAEQVDADAASRVAGVCERYGFQVSDAVCFLGRGGRMTVEILAADRNTRLDETVWLREVENACGRVFDHPQVTRMEDELKITLCEKPTYAVDVGAAQLCCAGEKLCGDAYEVFADGAGRQFLVLSDGMGSGGRAAVDGAMASGLTCRLIQAGLGADSVLRLVNAALMVKSTDESLATLDIAAVDLFSGRIDLLKAGAAASLLRSMGRVSRMEPASMPLGILRETAFARTHDTLVKGDIFVMMSDGALTSGIGWVEETLRDFDEGQGMTRLAEQIAAEARRRQNDRQDDITVLAMRLRKRA